MDEKHPKPARLVLDYEPIRPQESGLQQYANPSVMIWAFWLIIIAVAILAPIASDNGRFARAREAKTRAARATIQNLTTALNDFKVDCQQSPSTSDGLAALVEDPPKPGWHGPYYRAIPLDPWGHEFIYLYPGVHDPAGYDLSSAGPDGLPGTSDDITNWKK
jgi:general secretion pathway protein G